MGGDWTRREFLERRPRQLPSRFQEPRETSSQSGFTSLTPKSEWMLISQCRHNYQHTPLKRAASTNRAIPSIISSITSARVRPSPTASTQAQTSSPGSPSLPGKSSILGSSHCRRELAFYQPLPTPSSSRRNNFMQRRDFLKATGTIIAASTLPSASAFAVDPDPKSRVVLPMNRKWRYHPSKVEGAHLSSFNDASFEPVVIPHTNIRLPWHSFDDSTYAFASTYRRRFRYPASAKGRRVFVDFEGAMTASTVWINGIALGEYKGGFTPFSFELTEHLHPDAENVLVVQVDSTERADIPPSAMRLTTLPLGVYIARFHFASFH